METHFEVDVEAKNMPKTGKLLVTQFADEDKESGVRSQETVARHDRHARVGRHGHAIRATVIFNHTFVDAGEHLLRVLIEGDGLAVDNQQFYLASVPANVEVLIIDPRHDPTVGADPLASNSGYLRGAVDGQQCEQAECMELKIVPLILGEAPERPAERFSRRRKHELK